jgi:hypothetical protein
MERESEIQRSCLEYLNLIKYGFAFRVQTTGIYDPTKKVFRKNYNKGIADIIFIYRGECICIEVKSEKGQLRPDQKLWAGRVQDAEGIYLVVHSLDELIDDLKHIVKKER